MEARSSGVSILYICESPVNVRLSDDTGFAVVLISVTITLKVGLRAHPPTHSRKREIGSDPQVTADTPGARKSILSISCTVRTLSPTGLEWRRQRVVVVVAVAVAVVLVVCGCGGVWCVVAATVCGGGVWWQRRCVVAVAVAVAVQSLLTRSPGPRCLS